MCSLCCPSVCRLVQNKSNYCFQFIILPSAAGLCHVTLLFLPLEAEATVLPSCPHPTSIDLGFGHLTCFGQWSVSRHVPLWWGWPSCLSHHHRKSYPWMAEAWVPEGTYVAQTRAGGASSARSQLEMEPPSRA